MSTTTHMYVGFNADGEARAFCWDDPGFEVDTVLTIHEWEMAGRRVERVTAEEGLALLRAGRAALASGEG